MKKGALTVGVALLAFLGILLWQLPASWLKSFLPNNIACADLAGTAWNGQCVALTVQSRPIGDVTWDISAWRLLTGRVVGDIALTRGTLGATGTVALSFAGDGEVLNLKATVPLDPAVVPGIPNYLVGTVQADLAKIAIEQRKLKELRGLVAVRDLRRTDGARFALGNYDVTFENAPLPDGSIEGKLVDRGGPLAVSGTIKLTPEPGYEVSGVVTARGDAPQSLRRQLEFLGPADAAGARQFSLAGTM
jgi:Type II secretion system (T2SS), protein N